MGSINKQTKFKCDAMRLLLCNLKWAREGIYANLDAKK